MKWNVLIVLILFVFLIFSCQKNSSNDKKFELKFVSQMSKVGFGIDLTFDGISLRDVDFHTTSVDDLMKHISNFSKNKKTFYVKILLLSGNEKQDKDFSKLLNILSEIKNKLNQSDCKVCVYIDSFAG